ncbi:MAG: hypothetical protein WCH61_06005 [bacterium]
MVPPADSARPEFAAFARPAGSFPSVTVTDPPKQGSVSLAMGLKGKRISATVLLPGKETGLIEINYLINNKPSLLIYRLLVYLWHE